MEKKDQLHMIVGLGITGLSCARYLQEKSVRFALADSRINPPGLVEIINEFPSVPIALGKFTEHTFAEADILIVSPGVSLKESAIAAEIAKGKFVCGDIELFAQAATAPIIAITGTNAKSTVTTLVGEMAKTAGLQVQVGGNLGIPALDLLKPKGTELYVMELSSFQLETTHSLAPHVATILNVTPDHMDRYATLEEYSLAKFRIYSDCLIAVCNRDDPLTECGEQYAERKLYFTLNEPNKDEFGLRKVNDETYLAFEDRLLMRTQDLPVIGKHYQANALASLAIGYGYGLSFDAMLKTLKEFKGLPHRCQLVRDAHKVRWYNDSKGTNVGASLAAIEGIGSEITGKIILIAGGLGKNADFSLLVPAIEKYVKQVILIGKAAPIIAAAIAGKVTTQSVASLEEAVTLANTLAREEDCVLLSPACASYDMFKNFEHRGEVFTRIVSELK